MPKNQNEPVTVSAEAPPVGDFPLSLDEFCQRLSTTDKRVELIGAFHHVEKSAGRGQDTSQKFADRFAAFVNQPA
jgi:hypothetical protein